MPAWTAVLAAASSLSLAQPPPPGGGDPTPRREDTPQPPPLPSVRLRVKSGAPSGDLDFLRGSLVVQLLDRGYCVTGEDADLSVSVEPRDGAMVVEVTGGDGEPVVHEIPGTGAVAALEAVHRTDAALARRRSPSMQGADCRAQAVAVRIDDDDDETSVLVRDWVGGLMGAGAPLVRGSADAADRLCLRRDAEGLAVGRGEACMPVVQLNRDEGEDPRREIERAVGAALAIATETQTEAEAEAEAKPKTVTPPPPEAVPESQPSSTVPPPPELGPTVEPAATSTPPAATLHAIVAGGVAARNGGIDGVAMLTAGTLLRPGVVVAADVTVLPAALQNDVVAVDTDMALDVGYRLPLGPRSGLRFDVLGGARLHTWRTDGGPTSVGRVTWLVGAGLAGWWRIGRDLTLELGLRQHVVGEGWRHEVGLNVAGERGRSATMLVAGVGWLGRRR